MIWKDLLQVWHNEDLISDEEIKVLIRQWRNSELIQSDWTQLLDSPIINKTIWADYRQQLRDMPAQGADPKQWLFPIKPT